MYDIYRTRFQIEFCFRDGHQFTGLLDCQARDEKALDFAYNASLAAVNITKVLRKQTKTTFSIGQIKSLMVNAHFLKRFFDLSGIDPDKTLNAKLVKELFGIAVDAAYPMNKFLTNYCFLVTGEFLDATGCIFLMPWWRSMRYVSPKNESVTGQTN